MALRFYPKVGSIFMCDFSGFVVPEMVKTREIVILRARGTLRSGLATIVPLSTTPPLAQDTCHWVIPPKCLPNTARYKNKDIWVKGDMVYTVSYDRLTPIYLGKHKGKRQYFSQKLGREHMLEIYRCVYHGILPTGFTPSTP